MPAYQYQPLGPGQIRLIELFPNTHGDGLTGRLYVIMLRDYNAADDDDDGIKNTQHFEALSYVWGSDAKPYVLTTPDAGALPMTASLTDHACYGRTVSASTRPMRERRSSRSSSWPTSTAALGELSRTSVEVTTAR